MGLRAAVVMMALGCHAAEPAKMMPPPVPRAAAPQPPVGPRCRNGFLAGTSGWIDGESSSVRMEGSAKATPSFTLEETDAAVCGALADLQRCVMSARKGKPSVAGSIELGFDVADGAVWDVKIVTSSIADPDVMICVGKVMKGVRFGATRTGNARYLLDVTTRVFRVVKMIETGTELTGTLAPEPVKRTLRAAFPRFRGCYEQALKKDALVTGIASFSFTIDAKGAVAMPQIESTFSDVNVASCLVAVLSSLTFPKPVSGTVSVKYGIEFQNQE